MSIILIVHILTVIIFENVTGDKKKGEKNIMNKLFTKIAASVLGLSMAVGVGVAAGTSQGEASPVHAGSGNTLTFNASSEISGDFDANWAYAFTKGDNGNEPAAYANGIRVYNAKGSNKLGGHLTLSPKASNTDGYITGVDFTVASGKNPTLKVKTGSTSSEMSSATASTLESSSSTSYSWTTTSTSIRYIEFTTYNNNANAYTQWIVSGLKITYVGPSSSAVDTNMTITAANGKTTLNPSLSSPKDSVQLTASVTYNSGASTVSNPAIPWTSSNTNVATVSGSTSTATVTAAGRGQTTITASYAGDSDYAASSSTITIYCYDYSTSFAVTSFADAKAAAVAAGSSEVGPYFIVGHIKSITSTFYGNGVLANTGASEDLTIYGMYDVNGNKGSTMSNPSQPVADDVVVLEGKILMYNSTTFEIKDAVVRQLNGTVYNYPITVSSIAVKTAPTKLIYKSGADFDPTGLVITVTYSDSSTEDIAYNNTTASDFSFSPAVITASGDVTITYGGKECSQAVSLATITNVTGVASAPTEVYQNGTISPSQVTLNVTYSDSSNGTVTADSVSIDTTVVGEVTATATYNAATNTKTASWTVNVLKEPTYVEVSDTITLTLTGVSPNAGYTPWSNKSDVSSAVYSGNNGGGNSSLQYNNSSTSGLYSTTSGGKLYSVSVEFESHSGNGRKISVYGSNEAPESISDGKVNHLGDIAYGTNTSITDDDFEYSYITICGGGNAVYISSITITWKVPGAEKPLTANPILTVGKNSINVGKTTTLGITTIPADSDEIINVTSSDETKVTVTGSGRNFVIHAIAIGSATITARGAESTSYYSTVTITVVAPQKTYEDKILTQESLGIGAYDTDTSNDYTNDDVAYTCFNVMNTKGIQFRKDTPSAGYIANKEVLYDGANNAIKSITLIMDSSNTGYITVYEGTEANPSTDVADIEGTWVAGGVNTYIFSEGMTFFKLQASGTTHVRQIIVELVDEANSVLEEARSAALAILTNLSGLCGADAPGVVTQSDWDALSADLAALDLSSEAKLFLKNAQRISLENLSQGGAEIENAMAHYDACVTKFGFTPDSSITTAQASTRISPTSVVGDSSIMIITLVSLISISTFGAFLFLKKRKEQ